jgi:malate synthase
MEDAATAEISRSQLWQWVHHKAHLSDERAIDLDLCTKTLQEELTRLRASVGNIQFIASQYQRAAELLLDLIRSENFVEFLTLPAYDQLNSVDVAPLQKH